MTSTLFCRRAASEAAGWLFLIIILVIATFPHVADAGDTPNVNAYIGGVPIRVGILAPVTRVLQINPAKYASKIVVTTTGANEASLTLGKPQPGSGNILVTLAAADPIDGVANGTPASAPQGDETLVVTLGKTTLLEVPILVIVPAAIATPHPQLARTLISLRNVVATPDTSPAYAPPSGKVGLFTDAVTVMTIHVNDQFGGPLDSLYNGAPVFSNGASLNSPLTNQGTYAEPVGFASLLENADIGSAEIEPWPTFPGHAPVPSNSQVENYQIKIAGVILSPGVVNRRVTYQADSQTLTVLWP